MILIGLSIVFGLALLVWSADRFVEGAAAVAKYFGMSPLIIGMVVIGFGTSAPELVVSAMASVEGNPGIALGNAFGSNITNIGLILGLTVLLKPIQVHSQVIRKELPILSAITFLTIFLLFDHDLSRMDAVILLLVFAGLLGWTVIQDKQKGKDALSEEVEHELEDHKMPLTKAYLSVGLGLITLIISSRMLVWGAVSAAKLLGVSDIVIGLTIIAIGTSLPELAASIMAAKKGEPDLVLGNILGSNLFNTLGVVGLAGVISPLAVEPNVLTRDIATMTVLTLMLFILGYGFRGPARLNRFEGGFLLLSYVGYTTYLLMSTTA